MSAILDAFKGLADVLTTIPRIFESGADSFVEIADKAPGLLQKIIDVIVKVAEGFIKGLGIVKEIIIEATKFAPLIVVVVGALVVKQIVSASTIVT
jgi:hypothetical protein